MGAGLFTASSVVSPLQAMKANLILMFKKVGGERFLRLWIEIHQLFSKTLGFDNGSIWTP